MFTGVSEKLERAEYFLNNMNALAEEAGGFPYIKKTQELRANLDGFFFEVLSAKDFFLQGISEYYVLGLRKQEATDIATLKRRLESKSESKALEVVKGIGKKLDAKDTWLWRLNNYRNSATHRELLHLGHKIEIIHAVDKALFDDIAEAKKQGKLRIRPIFNGQEQSFPPDTPKVVIPREHIKTYLFKDPNDPQKGNMDTEVLLYCEQSLKLMRGFLENSYNGLGI